ncbi:MAG: radical SAM protein [Clostridioides sp.]|jgi:histone acetyltransferase (RNA polymerase elongator complex component)|nr:radical SAM protein [Clostridioides sp.]
MLKQRTKIIPIFVPHQGCPHDCIFCNQKKITGVSTNVTTAEVEKIIEESLEGIDKSANIEIAFFGGSFTAIDIQIQKELLSVAKRYIEKGFVNYIRISTRPDCIDENILKMLKEYKVEVIELGVQSLDEEVLEKSNRGHSVECVIKSANLIKKFGFKLGLQMMVGLPGDNGTKCMMTAKKFVELKPDCVRIYPTLVLKDTGLEKILETKEYKCFTLNECRNIVKKILVLFTINDINVIRVGLQATDEIQEGEAVVGGPYHPAFRQLVESDIIKDYIEYLIKDKEKYCVKHQTSVKILCNKKIISTIVGNKKENIEFFTKNYGIKLSVVDSLIYKDVELPKDTIEIILSYDKNNEIEAIEENFKISIEEIYNIMSKEYETTI